MKLIHTADLHIGKVVNEFSMLKDQEHVLRQMVQIAKEEKADAFLIAGDVYDRTIPPAEAVVLLDWFLRELAGLQIPVLMISGNHDSGERLGFAGSILEQKEFYIGSSFEGKLKKVTLNDTIGKINVYLLPFLKPQIVRHYLPEEPVHSYEEAVRAALATGQVDTGERNLLLTHYFVTNMGISPELSDSESRISVGGTDNVDVSVFSEFDYVALGHIHGPQKVGRESVRYAGSPLKYSFSEVFHKKSVTVIEMKEKGDVTIRTRELVPLHDMRKIKGTLEELMCPEVVGSADSLDYLHVTLTDREELMDAMGSLRSVYPNVMQLIIEKNMRADEARLSQTHEFREKKTLDIFQEFYELVTDQPFDEERQTVIAELIDQIEGGGSL